MHDFQKEDMIFAAGPGLAISCEWEGYGIAELTLRLPVPSV